MKHRGFAREKSRIGEKAKSSSHESPVPKPESRREKLIPGDMWSSRCKRDLKNA